MWFFSLVLVFGLLGCSSLSPRASSPVATSQAPAWLLYDPHCDRHREPWATEGPSACALKDKWVWESLKRSEARGGEVVLFLGPDSRCREQYEGHLACREALKCDLKALLKQSPAPVTAAEAAKRFPEICRIDLASQDFILGPETADAFRLDPNAFRESTPIAVKKTGTGEGANETSLDPSWNYLLD